jgi:cytochrome P450
MSAVPRIEDLKDTTFDPYVADELMFGDHLDPYARIADLRALAPVIEGDYRSLMGLPGEPVDSHKPVYLVLSHVAVETILHDPETFSNRSFEPSLGVVYGPILTVLDPPDHTKYRRILQRAFRPEMLRAWDREYVEPVLDELIGSLRAAGRADLISGLFRSESSTG